MAAKSMFLEEHKDGERVQIEVHLAHTSSNAVSLQTKAFKLNLVMIL